MLRAAVDESVWFGWVLSVASTRSRLAKVDALVGRMMRRNLPMGEMPVSNSFQAPASGWSPLLQVFDKVLPASPNSQHRKAKKLWEEGRTAEALDLLETAAERAPKNARLKLDLGRLLTEEGFYPEAEWSLVELAADLVVALTGGGPGLSSTLPTVVVYDFMFQRGELGRGSAAAVMLLASLTVLLLPYAAWRLWQQRRRPTHG